MPADGGCASRAETAPRATDRCGASAAAYESRGGRLAGNERRALRAVRAAVRQGSAMRAAAADRARIARSMGAGARPPGKRRRVRTSSLRRACPGAGRARSWRLGAPAVDAESKTESARCQTDTERPTQPAFTSATIEAARRTTTTNGDAGASLRTGCGAALKASRDGAPFSRTDPRRSAGTATKQEQRRLCGRCGGGDRRLARSRQIGGRWSRRASTRGAAGANSSLRPLLPITEACCSEARRKGANVGRTTLSC